MTEKHKNSVLHKHVVPAMDAGVYGLAGAAIGKYGYGNKAIVGGLAGAAAGYGLGRGLHYLEHKGNQHKVKRFDNKDKKWIVFGKGHSQLDNE